MGAALGLGIGYFFLPPSSEPPPVVPLPDHHRDDQQRAVSKANFEGKSAVLFQARSAVFDLRAPNNGPEPNGWEGLAEKLKQLHRGESDRDIAAQEIAIDTDTLLSLWNEANEKHALGRHVELLGKSMQLARIASTRDGDAQGKGLLFASSDSSQLVNLVVDVPTKTIRGYAFINGATYDIASARRTSTQQPSNQMLIQVRQFVGERKHVEDTLFFDHPGRSDLSTPKSDKLQYRVDDRFQDKVDESELAGVDCANVGPVTLQSPLRLFFAFTEAAESNAVENATAGSMLTLALETQGLLEHALNEAGVRVRVDANTPVKVSYTEPHARSSSEEDGKALLDQEMTDLRDGSDPGAVAFRQQRQQAKADIGILIVHNAPPGSQKDPAACGISAVPPMTAANALAIVHWSCIGVRLASEHEIGHLLGLYHQDGVGANPPYAKAFMHADEGDVKPFTTLMGEPAKCRSLGTSCQRIPMFSDPHAAYKTSDGHAFTIGTTGKIDSACRLRQTVPVAVTFGDHLD